MPSQSAITGASAEVGDNALIGTGLALLFSGVLVFALKAGAERTAPSHIPRHMAAKIYWMAALLGAVLLALSVKIALTPTRRDGPAGGMALDRAVATATTEQEGKRVAEAKMQRERGAAASTQREEVDRRYAEIAGIWSDNPNCAADSGSSLRISADGLDFGRSHFHVESVENKGNSLLLRGHYVTHQGIKEDRLTITVIDHNRPQIKISDKVYFICL